MFYIIATPEASFYRCLWALLCACLGFGYLTLTNLDNTDSPYPAYYINYPVILVLIAVVVFSILHLFSQSSGYVYYYLSFSLSFIFGYMVDYFWKITFRIVEQFKIK